MKKQKNHSQPKMRGLEDPTMLPKDTVKCTMVQLENTIKNPYSKKKNQPSKVSLLPVCLTQHKSWLAGSGQRQPPPTHGLRCDDNECETSGFNKEKDLHANETEIVHGDHGVFLCRNRKTLFLVVPIHDEWGVPDIQATLENAAPVPDDAVPGTNTAGIKKNDIGIANGKNINDEAEKLRQENKNITRTNDPQWLRGEYPSIPTMSEISELLCNEVDAIRFLANRGVIDPCGICTHCKGKETKNTVC